MPLSAQTALRAFKCTQLIFLNWMLIVFLIVVSWKAHVISIETLLFLIVNLNLEGIESLSVHLDRPPPLSVVWYLPSVLTAHDKMLDIGFVSMCNLVIFVAFQTLHHAGVCFRFQNHICLMVVIIKIVYILTLVHQTLVWWNFLLYQSS